LSDLTDGKFQTIIDDNIRPKKTRKLILCSGKIYYDLTQRRKELKNEDIVIIRIEQLFPLDKERLVNLIDSYNPSELIWAQEEPENMGAWTYIMSYLQDKNINLISRSSSAAPASGSPKESESRQLEIINNVFK
tara:strand:- start:498 stop:899 length:402 start_codon:yes stop_codon:yes gene_type:complete